MDKDGPKYGDHMVRSDLLSFFEGTTVIADRYLIDIAGLLLCDGQDFCLLAPSLSP